VIFRSELELFFSIMRFSSDVDGGEIDAMEVAPTRSCSCRAFASFDYPALLAGNAMLNLLHAGDTRENVSKWSFIFIAYAYLAMLVIGFPAFLVLVRTLTKMPIWIATWNRYLHRVCNAGFDGRAQTGEGWLFVILIATRCRRCTNILAIAARHL